MKKQALLIGINEYQTLPGLKYARQDAEAVADSLKQNYCFSDNEVMLLTDDRPGLFKPTDKYFIEDHLEKLADQDLDLFIFGFWGHGLFRNGKRYLCPLNVKKDRAEQQGLPFDELQELLAKIRAKNTCMILDCCQTVHDRGDAETFTVSDQTVIENAARDIVFRRKEQIPGFQSNVAILNSCKEGQSAYEWDARQHGLFTALLLDAMKKRTASVMQIVSYISSNIEKPASELGNEQTPFFKLEGDIALPVNPEPIPPEPDNPETKKSDNPNGGIQTKKEQTKPSKAAVQTSFVDSILSWFGFTEQPLKPGKRIKYKIRGEDFAFRWCPPGTFMMGSSTDELGHRNDEIQHEVTLTQGFWMMEKQVTKRQWKVIMGYDPSLFDNEYGSLPVVNVSWDDCQKFCHECAQLGMPVQLPTEAQWEYACRAGSTGMYAGNLDEMAWFKDNSCRTHSVGTKKPNAWGLYDMHGNVWEWCQDWYGDYPSESVTDPTGPSSGSNRVLRGGSWDYYAESCRSATRRYYVQNPRGSDLGFRVLRSQ